MNRVSGSGEHESTAGLVASNLADWEIDAAMDFSDAERKLFADSPITWLRGALALGTGRGASEVTDQEIAEKYIQDGFAEWDQRVVESHLDQIATQVTF